MEAPAAAVPEPAPSIIAPDVAEPSTGTPELRRSRRSTLSFEDAMAQKRAALEAPGERADVKSPVSTGGKRSKGASSSPLALPRADSPAVLSPPSIVTPDGRKRKLYEGIFENLDGLAQVPDQADKMLEWYCSHIDPRVVLWSSHPEILPPTIRYVSPDEDEVKRASDVKQEGNMFIVKAPDALPERADIWLPKLRDAARLILETPGVLLIAGAGFGVDSGLPDYRSPTGFWRAYPALQKAGITMEQMSSTNWFLNDPLLAWGFYAHRIQLYNAATPHAGFEVLRQLLTNLKQHNYFVFTSNIDSQFQKAGFEPSRIFECHGSLRHLQCIRGGRKKCTGKVWPLVESEIPEVNVDTLRCPTLEALPHCKWCGSVARPNVSMFGDTDLIFSDSRTKEQKQMFLGWLQAQRGRPLLVIEVGCGTSMHSLRVEAEALVQRRPQTSLVRINPAHYEVPAGSVGIGLGAKLALEHIADLLSK